MREAIELPAAFSLASGLSGIGYGPDGELLVEFEGAARTARLADAYRGSAAITPGWPTSAGLLVVTYDSARPGGQLGHRADVSYGVVSFEIVTDGYLGGIRPIGSDGRTVDLLIEELSQDADGTVHVGQVLQRRDRDGRLLASWKASELPYTYVAQPFAAEPAGDVLRLFTTADGVDVVRIELGD